jgi:hypothetical protein
MEGLMMSSPAPYEPDAWDLSCRKELAAMPRALDLLLNFRPARAAAVPDASDMKRREMLDSQVAERIRVRNDYVKYLYSKEVEAAQRPLEHPPSFNEIVGDAERSAPVVSTGNVLPFPKGSKVLASPDPVRSVRDGDGERDVGPSPLAAPVLIFPTESDIFFCSDKDHDSHKAFLAVREEHAIHAAKPDLPAWQNLLSTEEGQQMDLRGRES